MTFEEYKAQELDKKMGMYKLCLSVGEKEVAVKHLSEMYRLGLMTKERALEEIAKEKLTRVPVDPTNKWDPRLSEYRLPDCIIMDGFKLVDSAISVNMERRWIIRREMGYVGDQIAEAKSFMYYIRQLTTEKTAKNAIEDMENIFFKCTGKRINNNWLDALQNGRAYIYRVELNPDESFILPVFGYVFMRVSGPKSVSIIPIIDYKKMKELKLNSVKGLMDLQNAFVNSLKKFKPDIEVKIKDISNAQEFTVNDMMTREPIMTVDEMHAKRKLERETAAAKDYAEKNHVSFEEALEHLRKLEAEAEAKKAK